MIIQGIHKLPVIHKEKTDPNSDVTRNIMSSVLMYLVQLRSPGSDAAELAKSYISLAKSPAPGQLELNACIQVSSHPKKINK